MRRIFGAMCVVLAAWPLTARAAWHEASSAHFVIYADDSEQDVRRFSQQLERYHAAMTVLTNRASAPPSPSNRVTIYVVRDQRAVQSLHRTNRRNVAGFYMPRAGGSMAVVSQITPADGQPDFSMIALMHEYAHHFLIAGSAYAMPLWISEGAAEFFSGVRFESDGSLWLGAAPMHRQGELYYYSSAGQSVRSLLDPEKPQPGESARTGVSYGRSWLLYHYLMFNPARRVQYDKYVSLLTQGKPSGEAAREAFGDLQRLESSVAGYVSRGRLKAFHIGAADLRIGPIAVRRLSDGEAAMMPLRIRSKAGVNEEQAAEIVGQARAVAQRFPADAAILSDLAEAEYNAGNDSEAIAAADAALAIDPGQVNAHVQKGYALLRMAPQASNPQAVFNRARAAFVALNRSENKHPLPLIYFYRSYVAQGVNPPPLAIDGLVSALELAPFDFGLRMTLGAKLITLGRQAEARHVLEPVGADPHGAEQADAARKILGRLAAEPKWKGDGLDAILNPPGDDKPKT